MVCVCVCVLEMRGELVHCMCVFVSMQLRIVVLELCLSAINSPAKNIGVILTHLVGLIMVCVCVCACVRACVRVCMRVCLCVCVRTRVRNY